MNRTANSQIAILMSLRFLIELKWKQQSDWMLLNKL